MNKPVQITRYPNRRFYDRDASKYVSLQAIEEIVRGGKKVVIRDNQSGEDLTRAVLTRIIMERQPEKMLLFPPDLLHFILRSNQVMSDFLRDYFSHSLTYLDYLQRHSPNTTPLTRPMHWVKVWLDGITKSSGVAGSTVTAAGSSPAELTPAGPVSAGPVSAGPDLEGPAFGAAAMPAGALPAGEKQAVDAAEHRAAELAQRVAQLEQRLKQLESKDQTELTQ